MKIALLFVVLLSTFAIRAEIITGLDVMNQTTMKIDDEIFYQELLATMAAIEVRYGLLYLDVDKLPATIDAVQRQQVIDRINNRLNDEGERINTVADFERALELYSEPENGPKDFPAEESPPESFSNVTIDATAGIDCPTIQAMNAHISRYNKPYIHGKGKGGCIYRYGPLQNLTYNLYSYLQRYTFGWFGYYWKQTGTTPNMIRTGTTPQWWESNVIAKTICVNGYYRTRLALYINGSTSGRFYPYPGLYSSQVTYLRC